MTVVITMSTDVYFEGDDATFLPRDFELTGGGIADLAPEIPFRIDGLQSTIQRADDSFTLVFDTAIDKLRTTTAALVLKYTVTTGMILSTTRAALGAIENVPVAGPDEASTVAFTQLTAGEKNELNKARMIGTMIMADGDLFPFAEPPSAGLGIILPEAKAPSAATLTYSLLPDTYKTALGLEFDGDPAKRELTGLLSAVPLSRQLQYRAADQNGNEALLLFTIRVANVPDAPGIEGPPSLPPIPLRGRGRPQQPESDVEEGD